MLKVKIYVIIKSYDLDFSFIGNPFSPINLNKQLHKPLYNLIYKMALNSWSFLPSPEFYLTTPC